MIVENYTDKYLDDVVNIIKNFYNEAVCEYDNMISVDAIVETITNNKQSAENAFLLIVDGHCQGMIFGSRFKSLIGNNQIFQEIIWYVNENYRGYGISLLRHVEKLLKSQGISIMIMAVLENSKTEKIKSFYERLGFKPMETHYVRNL